MCNKCRSDTKYCFFINISTWVLRQRLAKDYNAIAIWCCNYWRCCCYSGGHFHWQPSATGKACQDVYSHVYQVRCLSSRVKTTFSHSQEKKHSPSFLTIHIARIGALMLIKGRVYEKRRTHALLYCWCLCSSSCVRDGCVLGWEFRGDGEDVLHTW